MPPKRPFLLAGSTRCQASRILTFLTAALLSACGRDAAETAYFDALRGGKNGMPVAEQRALMDKAIALRPDRAWYWEHRAGLRDPQGALGDLDRAIGLADRAYLRYSRGLVLVQAGRAREALPEFDRAIDRQPKNLQFYRGRGLARAETGDLRGARADAAFLLAKVPNWHDGHWVMGRVEELSGRCAAALPFYRKAASIRPELDEIRRALDRCRRKT